MYEMMRGYTDLFITRASFNTAWNFPRYFYLDILFVDVLFMVPVFAGPIPACRMQFHYI